MRWGYNRYAKPKVVVQKVNDPSIPARLDALIANSVITTNDKAICESLKQGWDRYGSITAGQNGLLLKMEQRYDASEVAKRTQTQNDWLSNFTPEMRARLNICAQYYVTTPYFRDIAVRVMNEPAWTPSEKQYRAMCENKYAQRIMENIETPVKYPVGSIVEIRKTARYWGDNKICAVIAYENVVGPAKGSRQYTLMPFGGDSKITMPERDIKIYRAKPEHEQGIEDDNEDAPF
jgi:hypothetical protein